MSRRPVSAVLQSSAASAAPNILDFREGLLGRQEAFGLPDEPFGFAAPFGLAPPGAQFAQGYPGMPYPAQPHTASLAQAYAAQAGFAAPFAAPFPGFPMPAQLGQHALGAHGAGCACPTCEPPKARARKARAPKSVDVGSEVRKCIQRRNNAGLYA
jgi:hypothetical protein